MLARAGLAPDALSGGKRVSLKRVLALIGIIDGQARPGWHIHPALDLEAAHHGPLGVAVVTAPTVATALETLTRFEVVRAPFVRIQPDGDNQRWRARMLATTEPTGPWTVLMEINLLALAGLIRRLLHPGADQLRLHLPQGYRPWETALLQALPGQIDVTDEEYRLSLPAGLLGQPCRLADSRLHVDAVARCQAIMAERFDCSPLEAELRRRILASIFCPPDQATLAHALGMSARTLHRRLKARGRSYRDIVGEVRASVARHRLCHTQTPISRIAEELGYQEPANFGRACRRWFGCSPGTLRHAGR